MQVDWSKAPEGATHWDARPHADKTWMRPNWRAGRGWDCWGCGHWVYYGEMPPEQEKQMIARPVDVPWAGEGLPPVGVVCEVDIEGWHICEVIAHFQQPCGMVAAFTIEGSGGAKILDAYGEGCFRPTRTPEQIATDKVVTGWLAAISIEYGQEASSKCESILRERGYRLPAKP